MGSGEQEGGKKARWGQGQDGGTCAGEEDVGEGRRQARILNVQGVEKEAPCVWMHLQEEDQGRRRNQHSA